MTHEQNSLSSHDKSQRAVLSEQGRRTPVQPSGLAGRTGRTGLLPCRPCPGVPDAGGEQRQVKGIIRHLQQMVGNEAVKGQQGYGVKKILVVPVFAATVYIEYSHQQHNDHTKAHEYVHIGAVQKKVFGALAFRGAAVSYHLNILAKQLDPVLFHGLLSHTDPPSRFLFKCIQQGIALLIGGCDHNGKCCHGRKYPGAGYFPAPGPQPSQSLAGIPSGKDPIANGKQDGYQGNAGGIQPRIAEVVDQTTEGQGKDIMPCP